MAKQRSTLVIVWSALAGLAACATFGRTSVVGTPAPAAEPRISYDSSPRPVVLERDSVTRIERGRLVFAGRPCEIRVDARDPSRAPRLTVDRSGGGRAFDGVLEGQWSADAPGARRTAAIEGRIDFLLAGEGGTTRAYGVELSYDGEGDDPGHLTAEAATWQLGDVDLGGRRFRYALRDRNVDGSYADVGALDLFIDRDDDGAFDDDGESFVAGESFNVGTGTYYLRAVSEDGMRAEFARALIPKATKAFLGRGDPAPAVEGTDLDGRPVSLAALRGRKALLIFWASWCGDCIHEVREISERWAEFKKELDGEVLGVCMDSDLAAARAFVADAHVPFASVADGRTWDGPIVRAYGIRSISAAVLVGPDGRILRRRAFPFEYLPSAK